MNLKELLKKLPEKQTPKNYSSENSDRYVGYAD